MVYSIVLKHRINLVIRLVVTKEGRREDMPEAQPVHRVASCCEVHAHSVNWSRAAMIEGKLKANTSAPF